MENPGILLSLVSEHHVEKKSPETKSSSAKSVFRFLLKTGTGFC